MLAGGVVVVRTERYARATGTRLYVRESNKNVEEEGGDGNQQITTSSVLRKGTYWTTKVHRSSRPEVGGRIVCAVVYLPKSYFSLTTPASSWILGSSGIEYQVSFCVYLCLGDIFSSSTPFFGLSYSSVFFDRLSYFPS